MENTIKVIKKFDNSDEPKVWLQNGFVYKKIETDKSSIGKTGVTFLEPLIMEYARLKNVPSPEVVQIFDDQKVFATKFIEGVNGHELYKKITTKDRLLEYAESLRKIYFQIGIERKMDLKDLIFSLDNQDIIKCIPVDFERVKFNENLDWNLIFEIANKYGIDIPKISIPGKK